MKRVLDVLSITRFTCLLLLFIPLCSTAQNFLGISVNAGNWIKYSPSSTGFKRPMGISGSLAYITQYDITSQLGIQFQGELGVMSYNLKVVTNDTISTSGRKLVSPFNEYIIFYTKAGALITRSFSIAKRKLFIGLGGGATYYYCPFPTLEYGVGIIKPDNSEWNIFTSNLERTSKKIFGFVSAQAALSLTKKLMFTVSYAHTFSPIYKGSYEFYYTENPSKGNLTLYQRELKLGIFWKLSRD